MSTALSFTPSVPRSFSGKTSTPINTYKNQDNYLNPNNNSCHYKTYIFSTPSTPLPLKNTPPKLNPLFNNPIRNRFSPIHHSHIIIFYNYNHPYQIIIIFNTNSIHPPLYNNNSIHPPLYNPNNSLKILFNNSLIILYNSILLLLYNNRYNLFLFNNNLKIILYNTHPIILFNKDKYHHNSNQYKYRTYKNNLIKNHL